MAAEGPLIYRECVSEADIASGAVRAGGPAEVLWYHPPSRAAPTPCRAMSV
jgi:hypothetical protein